MTRRLLIHAAFASAVLALTAHAHAADKYPDKPITLIVPFAPGGNLDIVGRALAAGLGTALGGTAIVENRAGAGGAVGASFVARAKPDGYTLMVSTPNALVVSPLIAKTTYELDNFAPIGTISTTPLTIVVGAKSPFTTIQALLAAVRAKPGKLSVGHSGNGTTNHVALLQLESDAKLDFNIVPYKGSGPALTDLMGGQLDLVVDQLTSSANFIRAGSLRALAVMSAKRDPGLPDVPTLREAGVTNFDASTIAGLFAPAGTPPAVVDALNAAIHKALADPATAKSLLAIGSPAQTSTTAEWTARLKHEQATAQALSKAGLLRGE
ncbi:MAG TPA: tripartite tricarboxylate transporter substrate binding protein [Burkholderiaceae bacterium]|jgi:tripartite-type tricarboxylate transporter receptor subunit TctC